MKNLCLSKECEKVSIKFLNKSFMENMYLVFHLRIIIVSRLSELFCMFNFLRCMSSVRLLDLDNTCADDIFREDPKHDRVVTKSNLIYTPAYIYIRSGKYNVVIFTCLLWIYGDISRCIFFVAYLLYMAS